MKIIQISGKMGSGKSSVADALALVLYSKGYHPMRTRYASMLYEMHNAVRDIAIQYGLDFPAKHGMLLQILGTEIIRDTIDQNGHVNALKHKVNTTKADFAIIDDCRFPNELHAFDGSDHKVYNIRLEADREVRKSRADAWRDNENHPSEISLDNHLGEFDLILRTDAPDSSIARTADQIMALIQNDL